MNQTSILIANRHISKGEEITRSYGVDYRKTSLKQREYHLLKNYIFQCECRACIEKWPLSDLIPDELARIPNFEQERCFVVRHGDKKDICDEINGARWMADFGIASNTFNVAQEALDLLSLCLNKHVVKPHLHFVEASELAEKFAINQYCRMPLEIVDEEEMNSCDKTVYDGDEIIDYKHNGKRTNVDENHNIKTSEDHLDGTNKLIQSFENGPSEKKAPIIDTARQKSPTLRMFATTFDEEFKGKGPRKKTVLERIEDKFSSQNLEGSQSKFKKDSGKRELAESMRRFSKKEIMADRLSAFQPKNILSKPKIEDKVLPVQANKIYETEVNSHRTDDETKRKSLVLDVLDQIKEKVSSNKKQKTDEEITHEINQMIDSHRKKIREERNKKCNKENRPMLNSLPQYEALETKDNDCQREIVKREKMLNKIVESSNEREKMLKDREKEIRRLREKTKKMLEDAKKKSEEFDLTEKSFLKTSNKHPDLEDQSRPRKTKNGQKSRKPNQKNKYKNAESGTSDDDMDLLAFLRQSHKKKSNIYDFLDSSKPRNVPEPQNKSNSVTKIIDANVFENVNTSTNDDIESSIQQIKNYTNSFKEISIDKKSKYNNIYNAFPKQKFIEDRWEEMKAKEERGNLLLSTEKVIDDADVNTINQNNENNHDSLLGPKVIDFPDSNNLDIEELIVNVDEKVEKNVEVVGFTTDQILINGKHWEMEIEESIEKISGVSRQDSSEVNSASPSFDDNKDTRHYSKRWSEERAVLSPSPCPERNQRISISPDGSRSTSRSPR